MKRITYFIILLSFSVGVTAMELSFVSKIDLASEAQISEFENQVGAELPSDYRAFLMSRGGGQVLFKVEGDVGFGVQWKLRNRLKKEAIVDSFYPVKASSPIGCSLGGEYSAFSLENRIPPGTILIGHDPGANQILLGIKGDIKGKVFFWPRDVEPVDVDVTPSIDEAGFVANSFTEFFDNLYPRRDVHEMYEEKGLL